MAISILGILVFLAMQPRIGFATTGMKMRRAIPASWSLSEFVKLKPSRWKLNQYYSFTEENVRSLGHRYVGRLDGAILHWESAPILDLVIEYKFPMKYLPQRARDEDMFQSGLYALALQESGFSCSSTKLVTIYCLQENAKRCLEKKSTRNCWHCRNGRSYATRFKQKDVEKELRRLDEVWYEGRKPRPTQEASACRICPYSEGKCNYSVI